MAFLPRNYKRGIEWLNDHRPFFTVLVTNLGVPIDDRNIDTACVRLRHNSDVFEIAVNEDFLEPLTDEEVAGVLSHEAFHILFDHFDDLSDDTMDKAWKRTQAQECICNDNILDEGIKLPDLRYIDPRTGRLVGGLWYGPNVVGRAVSGYTTKEVYDLIPDPPEDDGDGQGDGKGGAGQPGDGKNQTGGENGQNGHLGDLTPEQVEKLKEAIKNGVQQAIKNGSIKPDDLPAGDALKEATDVDQGIGQKAGTQGMAGTHALLEKNITLEWAKYIREIDPTAFNSGGDFGRMKYSFQSLPRKTAHMAKLGYRLPVQVPKVSPQNLNGGMKPHIVLALDFSGSIPATMIEVMANLANTVPNTINVACCTFSTFYLPYDPKLKTQQDVARGGTNFDAVSDYVDSLKLKQYPSVVVLTDGEAGFWRNVPTTEQLDKKWNWLLINRRNRCHAHQVKDSTVRYLDDFVKGL